MTRRTRVRRVLGATLTLATLGWAAAVAAADPQEARIRRVEQGLLPPVVFGDEKGWSLEERMKLYKVPGLNIAVFENGNLLWTKGYGVADASTGSPATATTLFQAASISKPLTCYAALRLVQEGKLDLDAPVNTLLTSWKLPDNNLTRESPVTFRRIMSHSAGLTVHGFPGYEPGVPMPTVQQILDGRPPANTGPVRVDIPPGTKVRYSGGGTVILGLAMAEAAGEPFPALMERLALKPLGMSHSGYLQPLPPDKAPLAATAHDQNAKPLEGKWHVYPELAPAGLWTTAEDLARFAMGVQASLRGQKDAVLPQELAWAMVTKVTDQTGLGFFIEEDATKSLFEHGGGNAGFQCTLVASKTRGHGVAIMTNSENGGRLMPEILRAVAQEYGWEDLQAPAYRPVSLGAEKLKSFEGRYKYGADDAAQIRVCGGGLCAEPMDEDPLTLVPISENEFVGREQAARFKFVPPGRLEIFLGGARIVAERFKPSDKLPSDLAFEGNVEAAAAEYKRLETAGDDAGNEDRLNNLGYKMASQDIKKAQAILRVNTLLYPGSANAYDSLAEISLQAGDKATAVECYKKVLEVLDRDTKASAGLKDLLRKNAETQLKKLGQGK